ncbi:hypothetical protein L6452_02891 [Arctium lappa]|uniref:Uncharacterized protein n=1 Tax=Arctium lappa TaxID=4217 RepID=A0ACB9FKU0_ARCLA|nr:hypothetical protein L6452_02891 [Arctium lappa]
MKFGEEFLPHNDQNCWNFLGALAPLRAGLVLDRDIILVKMWGHLRTLSLNHCHITHYFFVRSYSVSSLVV